MRVVAAGACVAGALLAAAGPATAGRAWSTVGDTTAEMRWDGRRAAPATLTLTVTRGDASTTFRSLAGSRWGVASGVPLVVRDLDRDGVPEAVGQLAARGTPARTRTVIAHRVAEGFDRLTTHDWGTAGHRTVDLNRDGRPEFVTADTRLAGLPGVGARAERLPIRIWAYRGGAMVDVTRGHRRTVRADMLTHLRAIDDLEGRGASPRGAIAAYLADARLLGAGDGPWNRMRARHTGPGAERFFAALGRRLDTTFATDGDRR